MFYIIPPCKIAFKPLRIFLGYLPLQNFYKPLKLHSVASQSITQGNLLPSLHLALVTSPPDKPLLILYMYVWICCISEYILIKP